MTDYNIGSCGCCKTACCLSLELQIDFSTKNGANAFASVLRYRIGREDEWSMWFEFINVSNFPSAIVVSPTNISNNVGSTTNVTFDNFLWQDAFCGWIYFCGTYSLELISKATKSFGDAIDGTTDILNITSCETEPCE